MASTVSPDRASRRATGLLSSTGVAQTSSIPIRLSPSTDQKGNRATPEGAARSRLQSDHDDVAVRIVLNVAGVDPDQGHAVAIAEVDDRVAIDAGNVGGKVG